ELLGLPKERAEQALAQATTWLDTRPRCEACRAGLSPHAPYSVRAWLLEQAALLAFERALPLAIHLAETLAEKELLKHSRGPFVAFLRELGVWDATGLVDSVPRVLELCDQPRTQLFIHGNYFDARTPLIRGGSVVYCPRTHAVFEHSPHPF